MKAFILAAGLGTRLRPLTDHQPKALVPVTGEPMISSLIRHLERAGYDDLTVNIHHFPDMMEQYLSSRHPSVRISDERDALLETGGALKKAEPLLRGAASFLVHNVDILSNASLRELHSVQDDASDGRLATLLVSDRPSSRRLLFEPGMRLAGWMNMTTGEIRSPYPDLDPDSCLKLAFSGIHVISEKIFPLLALWPDRFSITDFYIKVCDRIPIFGYAPSGLKVLDLGKPEALSLAESFRR